MSHTVRDKKKLVSRINRIRGQLDAVSREIVAERECSTILRTLTSCRGALNGLMSELIQGHVEHHVLDPHRRPTRAQGEAADELLRVVRSYLR